MSRTTSHGIGLGRALQRGADWRYLVLFVIGMLVPASLVMMPVSSFLQGLFDHSTRAGDLVKGLDSAAFVEVVRQMGDTAGLAIGPGFRAAVFVALLIAPALAGATVAVARKGGAGGFRGLLGAMGELYPRMFRLAVASVIPLGIAGALIAGVMHFAEKSSAAAVEESAASRMTVVTSGIAVVLVWLANATVDAGRAYFAADPERTGALAAWWSGVKLTVRRPGAVLGLSLVSTAVGVGIAAMVTAVRLRVPVTGNGGIGVGFVLAQVAVGAMGWGRASRVVGVAEVIRGEE